ncbi:uncharacterized protein [Miscanthus floridulus]|uniref:uncharacterized protein n=1 Tax=Miscanthus floridulus TaxID=154761 RepID=UPI0034584A09
MADNLPPWARKEIDAICRKFLWVGKDASVRGKCMVAWNTARRPTELGGLGITDLKLVGYALQTRWLWLQKTDSSRARSELPINAESEDDRWIQGQAPSDIAPNLVQLVPRRTRARLTVRQGLVNRQWTRNITGSLTPVTIAEYLDLWEATENISLNDQPDRTVWRWSPDGNYSAKSADRMMHVGSVPFRGHLLIWETWAPLRLTVYW